MIAASDQDAIHLAIQALRRGELIAIPTETVYGLAVLPTVDGIEKLIEAKHRSAEKGIQLLVDSLAQVEEMAVLTPVARKLGDRFWPGGLTIVLRQRADVSVPEALGGGRPTLGIRLPDHEVPRAIARELGPIAASSANISGQPPATDAKSAQSYFTDEIALILDDGPVRGGTSSTVVDCSDPEAEPAILREGAIAAADISEALR
jgi:tRNA threonylcarbamoyl adenosine modification protein (Sua5/YciO/YrdC/YwlC family)